MSLAFVLLHVIGLELMATICNGRPAFKYFSSRNCPKDAIKIAHMDTYYLIWEGQITPNLCRFTFNSGWKTGKICFRSEVYDMYHLMKGVRVEIINNKNTWDFDRYDHSIPRTCVPKANNLVISVILPHGYRAPKSKKYIKLKINAVKDPYADDDDDSEAEIPSTILGFVALVILAFIFGKKRDKISLAGLCQCCGEMLCYFITCKCLPKCDTPSCDCTLNDICQPCGECCSVCERQDYANETSEENTAMAVVTDESENVTVSTSASGITSSSSAYGITGDPLPPYESSEESRAMVGVTDESENVTVSTSAFGNTSSSSACGITEDPPPSYESARDMTVAIYIDRRPPPPNYEEVIAKM